MGGCRCIFRDCPVSSSAYPGMHFFHFPVKQKEKLNLWVKYAKANHILNLTPSQVKNKVVCNRHFRDECFMNYKKDRLTREAVPTITRLDDSNMILDFENSDNPTPTNLPITTAKHLLPPSTSISEKIEEIFFNSLDNDNDIEFYVKHDHDQPSTTIEHSSDTNTDNYFTLIGLVKESEPDNIVEEEEIEHKHPITIINKSSSDNEQPLPKKIKNLSSPPKILNRNAIPTIHHKIINGINSKPHSIKTKKKTILLNGSKTTKMYQNTKKISQKCNIHKKNISTDNEPTTVIDIAEIDPQSIFIDTSNIVIEKEDKKNVWEIQKLEYENKILELQEKLKAKDDEISKVTQIETVSTSKQIVPIPTAVQQKQLTKGQLFTGIKKYLCPSMSALVRMEMFSEPERNWKIDEKQAAIELLQLGDTVFDYFRDEWRFRLPPKKDVEQWMSANTNVDDEDDL